MDRLVEVLWADGAPPSALNSLQSKVSRLRADLGPAALKRVGTGYLLDLPPGACDADRFEDLVLSADGADPADVVARIDEALALWVGPAYDEFAADDFVRPSAVRLELRRLAAHEQRLEALLQLGRHDEVVAASDELIAADPFRESFWAARMRALALAGRSVDAVRCFQQAHERFVDETGIAPSAALSALERAILDGDVGPAPPGPGVPDPYPGGPAVVRARGPVALPAPPVTVRRPPDLPERPFEGRLQAVPLINRGEDRAVLERSLAAAVQGQPQLVIIEGVVGVGKTRLAEVATSMARAAGLRVLGGRCLLDVQLPLGPVGQIMRGLGVEQPLAGAGASLHRPSDPVNGPTSSAGSLAVLRLLDRLVEQPTVLILDDLQWADEATASALELLVAEADSRALADHVPLLVVVAHRPLDASRSAHAALDRLPRRSGTTVIQLEPLDEAGVAAMIEAATGIRPSGRAAWRIHELTDGVPLLVGTLLNGWSRGRELVVRAGCIDLAASAAPLAPADVDESIRARWAGLDPATADSLALLALCPLQTVVPLPTVTSVLAAVLEITPDAALRLVDEAIEAGLLVGSSQLRFASPRVRSYIREQTTRSRRADLLTRMLVELSEVPRLGGNEAVADRFPALVVHVLEELEASGASVDAEELRIWALRAAEASLDVGAWPAATHHLRVAERTLGGEERVFLSDGASLELALGLAEFRAHDEYRAQATLQRAAERARIDGDHGGEGQALCVLNRIAFAFQGASDLPLAPAAASDLLETYIGDNRAREPRMAALGSSLLAEYAAVQDRLDEATAHVERARSLVPGEPDGTLPEIDFAAGLTALNGLELAKAERQFQRSTEAAVAAGDRWVASWGAGRRILTRLMVDDLPGTGRAIDRALELQLTVRLWSELALTRALQAAHVAALGHDDAALALAEEADGLAVRSGYAVGRFIAGPTAACVLAGRGRLPEAMAWLDRVAAATGAPVWPFAALTRLHGGEPDAAAELIGDRFHRLARVPPSFNRLSAVVACAAVARAVGDDAGIAVTTPVLDWLDQHGVRRTPNWPVAIATLVARPSPAADVAPGAPR